MAAYSYKGVEYEFVNTPKEFLEELKCPICLELVSDPVQTSCGHLFCGECIEGINQCPLDRKHFFTTPTLDDINQKVRNLKVQCPDQERGCQWQGCLGEAEKHIDTSCNYQFVMCYNEGCGVEIERRNLVDHMYYVCPQRVYNCPFCNEEDTYLEVTTTHFTICDEIPLPCPAGCGKRGLVRRDMAHHLSVDCPDELVPCTFAIAGCQQIVKRKDLQQHLQDKDLHLGTVMSSYLSLSHHYQDLLHGSLPNIPFLFRPWLHNTPTCYPRPPWVISIQRVHEKIEMREAWFSDPVYSHYGGYKMCLKLLANGNRDGKGTHVAVYVLLMRGDNDDNLKWPFKGTIRVSLLNQLEDGQHHTKLAWSPYDDVAEDISGRVTGRERASSGWGIHKFISHRGLHYCGDKNRQYLKDNTLFFRVDSFE